MRETDEQLVRRFIERRDESAFSDLYDRHNPILFRVACRLMGRDSVSAADVIQETWLRASSHLHTFGWKSGLRTWLCGIAINCCREQLRKRRPMLTEEERNVGSPTSPAKSRALRLDLERAFESLSHGYRAVLYLHDVEGLTHEEVGETLGVDAGTSRSQLFKARRRVRERLGEAKPDRKERAHG